MHPMLEGENVWNVTDPKIRNFYLVQDQIEKAINGGGFTFYSWDFPNSKRIGKKVSYSRFLDECDLVLVGTVYVEDFNSAVNSIMRISFFASIILLCIGVVISVNFVKEINHPINMIVKAMKDVANGEYKKVKTIYSDKETGRLVSGYNDMVNAL